MKLFAKSLLLTAGLAISVFASAVDQLHNTRWTSFNSDDQPESVLQFTDNNGVLSAKIVEVLDPRAAGRSVCDTCRGQFHNQPLVGGTVLWDLVADPSDPNKYIDGSGIEPETGRTFSGKAELNGDTLRLRGYKGISLLGVTRELQRRR